VGLQQGHAAGVLLAAAGQQGAQIRGDHLGTGLCKHLMAQLGAVLELAQGPQAGPELLTINIHGHTVLSRQVARQAQD